MRARRADDVAHRRTAITGVNEYPNLAEPPLPPSSCGRRRPLRSRFRSPAYRSDAYLERTGARPAVLLLPLGPLAEHNIRATFAANLLASGGIEAVNPGTVDAAGVADAVRTAAAAVRSLRHRRPLRHRRRRGCGGRPVLRAANRFCWPARTRPSPTCLPTPGPTAI